MKTKKLLTYALIGFALIIIFLIVGRKAGWIGDSEALRVSTEKVGRRHIVEIVTASGKIQPVTEVKISPDVSGEIILLDVKEGDFVERGQLLARINPDLYESALDRVNAALNTSRANLANAKARASQSEAQFINATASYNRNKMLFDQNAISESEYDAARAQYLVAQAEVEAGRQSAIAAQYQVRSAEAAVKESGESLTKTNIFAPMDGTVSRLDVELGERVVGTSQFAGTEIMRVANLNQMEVVVSVNENDIIRVNPGDTAVIQIDAFYTDRFNGIVTSIANSAKVEGMSVDQVTNFEVRIQILPESYQHLQNAGQMHISPLRPGMSASVDIRTKQVYDAISVPIQSVTTREEEPTKNETGEEDVADETQEASPPQPAADRGFVRPQEYVFVFQDGKAVRKAVTTGIQDSQFIEVVEGLTDEDEVITGPYRLVSRTLKDGDDVERTKRQDLFKAE